MCVLKEIGRKDTRTVVGGPVSHTDREREREEKLSARLTHKFVLMSLGPILPANKFRRNAEDSRQNGGRGVGRKL